jgi:uncharacterized SAM-binding protein YcdF (DUF218 family)
MALKNSPPNLAQRLQRKKRKRWIFLAVIAFLVAIALKIVFNIAYVRPQNATRPIDAVFVLGGSIYREIYAAELAGRHAELPILISHGSETPCIVRVFQDFGARMDDVWIENCARSTFENFVFGVPILKGWGARHIKVITSQSHLPRAQWLAQIHLAAQGIAAELDIPQERGRPGNNESKIKTLLDVTRSLLWAGVAQVISVPCQNLVELDSVELRNWKKKPYQCEYYPRLSRSSPSHSENYFSSLPDP